MLRKRNTRNTQIFCFQNSSSSLKRGLYYSADNKLELLAQEIFRRQGKSDFDVAQHVVGTVFANKYSVIKNQMRVYAPTAYVDATKAYYSDAIQYGDIIAVSEDVLYKKFVRMGMRQAYTNAEFSFMTTVSELVSARLLEREGDEIVGVRGIYDNIKQYKDVIMTNAVEVT